MKVTKTVSRLVLGVFASAMFVAVAGAQTSGFNFSPSPGVAPSEANLFIETPKGWVHPKTAWGDPDLEGTWPIPAGINMVRTCPRGGGPGAGRAGGAAGRAGGADTGQGRGAGGPVAAAPAAPPCDLNQAFISEEEYQARVKQLSQPDRATQALAEGNFGAALQGGVTDPQTAVRQRSTIMDPPNGQLPELTPEGKRRSALMKSSWALPGEQQTWDAPEDFDSWDRCITRGMPSSMMAYRYNNGIKIFQAPGMVVLSLEMIHEDRIVYTDGRPPLKAPHKKYMGEPRGHWEGNTLVIVTTNYKEGPSGTNIGVYGAPQGNRWPVSDQMKTTERITRVNTDTILYEMKVEDPVIMTRSYTVKYPIKLDNKYEWWEYNCHEGNRTIRDYINSSRAERAAARGAGAGSQSSGQPAPAGGRGRQP